MSALAKMERDRARAMADALEALRSAEVAIGNLRSNARPDGWLERQDSRRLLSAANEAHEAVIRWNALDQCILEAHVEAKAASEGGAK